MPQVTKPAISASYTFTVIEFPGTFYTFGTAINSGAASSKVEMVGAIGPGVVNPIGFTGSFLMHYEQSKGITTSPSKM